MSICATPGLASTRINRLNNAGRTSPSPTVLLKSLHKAISARRTLYPKRLGSNPTLNGCDGALTILARGLALPPPARRLLARFMNSLSDRMALYQHRLPRTGGSQQTTLANGRAAG